jgi:hypothetical protein
LQQGTLRRAAFRPLVYQVYFTNTKHSMPLPRLLAPYGSMLDITLIWDGDMSIRLCGRADISIQTDSVPASISRRCTID